MRTAIMVGDYCTDPEMDAVIKLVSATTVDYACDGPYYVDRNLARGEVVVLQYGTLRDYDLDVIDRAIELGIPILEYK